MYVKNMSDHNKSDIGSIGGISDVTNKLYKFD